jgi:hypothetical protein
MLKNNNASMATIVETFIVEETSELIHDNEALQKWRDKVSELQLEGQTEVVVEDKSPIPFLWMNNALVSTFQALCPTKVKIEKYNKTPIPVEILELVSLSKKEQYFDRIEIWYNEQEKDPVCVGFVVDDGYKGREDYYVQIYSKKYLIGRWADVKASLDTLIERARKLWILSNVSQYKQQIRDYSRRIEDIEEEANRNFGGGMPATDLPF